MIMVIILRGDGDRVFFGPADDSLFDQPHFIVVGRNRFRLETDHKKSKAVASFNNASVGAYLYDLFDKIVEEIYNI